LICMFVYKNISPRKKRLFVGGPVLDRRNVWNRIPGGGKKKPGFTTG